jgi:transposase
LTTKIHQLCDAKMRPLVILLGTGQGGDSPMFPELMVSLRVDRIGPGRARPLRVLADKAYSSKANRAMLAAIWTASAEKSVAALVEEVLQHHVTRDISSALRAKHWNNARRVRLPGAADGCGGPTSNH